MSIIGPAPLGDAYAAGDVYRGDKGEVRIDRVTDEWIYFVSWRPGVEVGRPMRMTPSLFRASLEINSLALLPTEGVKP